MTNHPEAVRWSDDGGAVELIDQTRLPESEVRLRLHSAEEMAEAIRSLRVRGAPAIGIAAAMALAIEAARCSLLSTDAFDAELERAALVLRNARPTAVNLPWALGRMMRRARAMDAVPQEQVVQALYQEATAIAAEDRAMCLRIGEHGLGLLPDGEFNVLTCGNAGALATGGIGTALAPLYLAHERGRRFRVFVGETRPLLQGSRLTAWELGRAGIDATVLVDSAAGALMRQKHVDLVLVGADRIAANGDVANKVGTYALAVLAKHHGIPFYVAAPVSTLDLATSQGEAIQIEERDGDEVRRGFGRLTSPAGVAVWSPAFDITPVDLVTALVTDRGVLRPPFLRAGRQVPAESAVPAS